jgi:transposase-like protein
MTKKKRQFTLEFKADTIKLVRAGGRSIGEGAMDLDLAERVPQKWVRRAEIEAGEGPLGKSVRNPEFAIGYETPW